MPNTRFMLFGMLTAMAIVFAVISQVIHISVLDTLLAIIAIFVSLAAFLTKDYLYLLDAVKKRKDRTLILGDGEASTIAPSENAMVRRENGKIYGSAFVKIPMYRSSTEMNDEEKTEISKMFGRILTLSKNPIKLSAQLYMINKDEYINKLRDILNRSEERYRNIQASKDPGSSKSGEQERIRGEITMWRNLLDNVSSSRSQSLVLYAMVSAIGGTEEEAANIAYSQAEDLAGGISATLGVTASVVTGKEILSFVEPDFMIPTETISERMHQKTIGGS